jgi:AcrR family transcriptional regulator
MTDRPGRPREARVAALRSEDQLEVGSAAVPDLVSPEPGRGGRGGRPRDPSRDGAIRGAILRVLAEDGYSGLTMDAVATAAGVGKATIYRRWPSKEDLLLAVISTLRAPLPEPAGRSVREDLVTLLGALRNDWADPRRARVFALLLGEGARYPGLMERYRDMVVKPRQEVIRGVLRRGAASGELRPDVDIDAALYMLTGAVVSRGKYDAIPPGYVERVVDELVRGLAPR